MILSYTSFSCSSTGPFEIYKTSEMAKDVVELLDHLSWNHHRSLHIVGVSMGGMITQELVKFLILFFWGGGVESKSVCTYHQTWSSKD